MSVLLIEKVTIGRGKPLMLQRRRTSSPSFKQGSERVRPVTETGAEGEKKEIGRERGRGEREGEREREEERERRRE